MNSYIVDENQYIDAVNHCNKIYQGLYNFIQQYSHRNLIRISYDENKYYFKVIRNDNMNGFQVCVSPVDLEVVIYLINNGVKDINQKIDVTDNDQLIKFFNNFLSQK